MKEFAGRSALVARLWMAAVAAAAVAGCGGGGDAPAGLGQGIEQSADAGAKAGLSGAAGSSSAAGGKTVQKAAASVASGKWGPVLPLPLTPASAANLPDGRVLFWAADSRFSFGSGGQVYTTLFDPTDGSATNAIVSATGQNMFCPGTTNLPDGKILVSGGSAAARTSIYDPASAVWTKSADMRIPRAYQANTLLRDGSVLTLGGSWAGGVGNKGAEIWTQSGGWSLLPGVRVDAFMTKDPAGPYRADNHMWLLAAGNGKVFHAGPSAQMHWIDTEAGGRVLAAGARADDGDSMSGNAVMYDTGKILKVGGSPAYDHVNATAASQVIDIRTGVKVRKLAPMAYARAFHNSVVLPNGQVMVIGGQSYPVPFSDSTSVLPAELWDPVTEVFTVLEPMKVPRNYHSVALLLPDARVLSAGSGLCGSGCSANHPDAQIYSPHYLFNADGTNATRPVITAAPTAVTHGTKMAVRSDGPISAFSLVRLSSATHSVNNDQRRLSLRFERTGNNAYALAIPSNPGWAPPGKYMLFAMNEQGVPSVARTVTLSAAGMPLVQPIQDQVSTMGRPASLVLPRVGNGQLGVLGLPPGLSFDPASLTIRGTATAPGSFNVTVQATQSAGTVSTDFVWQVSPYDSGRFVKLEQLSEVGGAAFGSMAELNLLGTRGETVDRTGWKISASSEERSGENGAAANAIDGDANTIWHSRRTPPAVFPHSVVVDLGRTLPLSGLSYLPRRDGSDGTMARFRIYLSDDGIQWGDPVAEGDFSQIQAGPAGDKIALFRAGSAVGNLPPVLMAPDDMRSLVGETVLLDLIASDDQPGQLRFAVRNLPPGLNLRAETGVISGVPRAPGRHEVTVTVSDAQGAATAVNFVWQVLDQPPPVPSMTVPVATAGTEALLTASVPAGANNLTYSWDFGDGSPVTGFATASSARHTYSAPGLYTVTLQVRGADGQITVHRFTQAVASNTPATAKRPVASSNLGWLASADGRTGQLWAVNADADTVSVFDGSGLAKLAEVPVGTAPRSLAVLQGRRQVWVANRDGASISIIDADARKVVRTVSLPVASQPWGIVAAPSGDRVYVTLEATSQLLQMDVEGRVLATLKLPGAPRHLAVTADGAKLLVARFISAPQPGESGAVVRAESGGKPSGGEVWAVRTAPLALDKAIVLQHSRKADSTTQGRGVPNYLGAPAIAPDGLSAWVPSKQDNIYRGKLRDGLDLNFENTVRAISSRLSLQQMEEDAPARIDHDNSSVASAALFHPTGAYLFTALETSRELAVVDPVGRREVMRVDTGLAPQGLALSGDGLSLFVSNFMDRTVAVYDLAPLLRQGQTSLPRKRVVSSVATEKLSAKVLRGKQLFYDARDPRLARDAYMSCAACHNDGGNDGRTWDLTGRGEGVRNTISLRGRGGAQGRLHWTGNFDEVQDFEGQIRALAGGTGLMTDAKFNAGTVAQPLGSPKAGLSADLDALAAYLGSLNTFARSPLRQADGQLSPLAKAGRAVFTAQCVSCHGGKDFTNSALGSLSLVGTLKTASGKRLGEAIPGLDIPTLRDVWATAPYLHDGSAATLADAIRAHTRLPSLSAADLSSVSAFVGEIGGTEPMIPVRGRFVRLEALSGVADTAWATIAELDLLDTSGRALPRTGWKVRADSEETSVLNGRVSNIVDGKANTIWHSTYRPKPTPMPHWVVIDIGATKEIGGFRYQPRPGGGSGTIDSYRLLVSLDGERWAPAASQGRFSALGPSAEAKTVMFAK